MKERPILFSGPLVRAILDGRKTQTRRVLKKQPYPVNIGNVNTGREEPREPYGYWGEDREFYPTDCEEFLAGCPYGVPGDRLWVRETWVPLLAVSPASNAPNEWEGRYVKQVEPPERRPDGGWYFSGLEIAYRADGEVEFCDGDGFSGDTADRDDMPRWRPSIHMPRKYSRILLGIVDVRVERLQDISEEDAQAEGVEASQTVVTRDGRLCYSDTFRKLWTSLHGIDNPKAWDTDPWVWVLKFKRIDNQQQEEYGTTDIVHSR